MTMLLADQLATVRFKTSRVEDTDRRKKSANLQYRHCLERHGRPGRISQIGSLE
jgi:hypothetical protein